MIKSKTDKSKVQDKKKQYIQKIYFKILELIYMSKLEITSKCSHKPGFVVMKRGTNIKLQKK